MSCICLKLSITISISLMNHKQQSVLKEKKSVFSSTRISKKGQWPFKILRSLRTVKEKFMQAGIFTYVVIRKSAEKNFKLKC